MEYYYIYKAVTFSENKRDTLFFLTSKWNNTSDAKDIRLKAGKNYKVETRFYSAVKISKDNYLFCKPGGNIFENDTISMNSLPILILEAEEVKTN